MTRPEGEDIIQTDPYTAFWYAQDVIEGRWPEAEEIIKSNPKYANRYAKFLKEIGEKK